MGTKRQVKTTVLTVGLALVLLAACTGDKEVPFGTSQPNIQGVWEGEMTLTAVDFTEQSSPIRLELVQNDFAFDGYLLKTDPFSLGHSSQVVDTLLVRNGAVSGNFVSFKVTDPLGDAAVFEGNLERYRLSGTAVSAGYTGVWSVEFLY
ncbi:MAG: hypothetical protein U9P14_02370 [Gemmatimonadota bacterium]|nr:hypothetical protein [Gemmatimonadota bacterium]